MSTPRGKTPWWGWLLLVVALACAVGLEMAVIYKLDRWMVLPFALLAHGALLPSVAAAGLSLRVGGAGFVWSSRLLAGVMIVLWLNTWFVPVQRLFAWVALHWYLFTQV